MNDTPPEITTVLFIGGILDRRRRQDKKIQYLKVVEPEQSPPANFDFSKPAKLNLREDTYRRETLKSGETTCFFYVLDSMTTAQAMDALLKAYYLQDSELAHLQCLACVALGITTEHDDSGETLLDAVRALLKDRNEWKEEADLREKRSDVWAHECDVLREQLKKDEKALEDNIEIFVDLKETINKAEDQLASERKLADQLAAIVQRDRDGHGGMLTDPECFCEDCEHLRVLDAALNAWKEARK